MARAIMIPSTMARASMTVSTASHRQRWSSVRMVHDHPGASGVEVEVEGDESHRLQPGAHPALGVGLAVEQEEAAAAGAGHLAPAGAAAAGHLVGLVDDRRRDAL